MIHLLFDFDTNFALLVFSRTHTQRERMSHSVCNESKFYRIHFCYLAGAGALSVHGIRASDSIYVTLCVCVSDTQPYAIVIKFREFKAFKAPQNR